MKIKTIKMYIYSDLSRYLDKSSINIIDFLKIYFKEPGFAFMFFWRLSQSNHLLSYIAKSQVYRLRMKHSLHISLNTKIGYGLYIAHGSNVYISPYAIIGNNVNLAQCVTIGTKTNKAATVNDNVCIYPNVCIVGDVIIGKSSHIGSGSVVTKNINDNSIYAGVPAKFIKEI